MERFYIQTLGCPKNSVDSEELYTMLTAGGLSPVERAEGADLVLVNTCGFIEEAKRESIEEILGILERRPPGQRLVVFGCLVQRYMAELRRELPEVDAFFGVDSLDELLDFCRAGARDRAAGPSPEAGRTTPYAYLKIADGCDRACSFCAIPGIRGGYRSVPPETLLKRAEALIGSGVRELILVAQDTTSYGREFGGYGLTDLIREITSIDGEFWLRLLYLYPTAIEDELLELVSTDEKVCRYMEIPLQHSEERLLRLMRRAGSRERFAALVRRIREVIPDVTIRTTFIVGFPTESDDEFRALLEFAGETGFERLGAFKYSREEGTPSYHLDGQIPEGVKQRRYHELMAQQAAVSLGKNLSMVGRTVRVLVDDVQEGVAFCRYEGQAPEIDGVVMVKLPPSAQSSGEDRSVSDRGGCRAGAFLDVRITDAYDYDLEGELL